MSGRRGRERATLFVFVAGALVGLLWWGLGSGDVAAIGGPNVLIISLDTVRADYCGFLGKRLPDGTSPTPNLDRLAARSAPMREGITPAPLTLPAHVSLMSGLYPDRHGARENDSFRVAPPEQREFRLLAEVLRERGYRTGAIVSGQPLEARYGLDAGFGTYNDTDSTNNPVDRLRFRERPAPETTGLAVDWLEGAGDASPWFLFAHYFDAHDPYVWHGPHPGLDPTARNDRYLSEIIFLDYWVGQLLAALPDGGRETAIFLLADHGEGLGEHGEETHGFTLHQSTLRVPFLFKPPQGVDASAFAAEGPPARLVDVTPTVLALVGESESGLDGRSLLQPAPDDWLAFAETLYPYYQFQYAHDRCCQNRQHKLISGGGREELYDWKSDRAESVDLASREPDVVKGLDRWLNGHLTRPGRSKAIDVLVEPNASFPYMGGRPLTFPVEPGFDDNALLPPVETKWEVIRALDQARRHLRPENREPNLASAVLAPFEADLDKNPALLWWTARAAQLESRNEGELSVASRIKLLERCVGLYRRHHRLFRDTRALDAALRSMLELEVIAPSRARLREVVEQAAAATNKTALTLALKARAHGRLGEFEEAVPDLERATRLETDPVLRRQMGEELKRMRKARETIRNR